MQEHATITLLANCGVLIRRGNVRILVDGLYSDRNHPFSLVPPALKNSLMAGEKPIGEINYVMFTHGHPDHFGIRATSQFLAANKVRGLLMPTDNSEPWMANRTRMMREWLDEHPQPVHYLDLPQGAAQNLKLEPGVEVTVFNSGHQGAHLKHNSNYVLLLRLDGINILITGDAYYSPTMFGRMLEGTPVDAMLINPLFFQQPKGVQVVNEVVKPRILVLYHLPFADNDKFGTRRMADRQAERHSREAYEIHVLRESLQTVDVPKTLGRILR
ncbi:MAG: MBL fold metallo-hydrolase [Ruminococcaceae bacterium]|nr:MBL fold metallo-hydrolase [Oscillospiraceae bacterium]